MHKGFTLIELLIVVIIVGILVTVALPQYKRAVERGRATVGIAAVREAADRYNAWYIQHNNRYPTSGGASNFPTSRLELVRVGNKAEDWFQILPPLSEIYLNDDDAGMAFTISRRCDSGWNYALRARLKNGELTSITCIENTSCGVPVDEKGVFDCVPLGLTGNLANL